MSEKDANVRLKGRPISQGLVLGRAFVYRERLEALAGAHEIEDHQVGEELRRIERAAETVAEDLRISAVRIEADANAKLAGIFEAHEAMLHDPELRKEIANLVSEELMSGAQALGRVFRRRERKFREMAEPASRRMADDIADLGQRLLREIAGVKTTSLEKMPPGRVLVASRLLPSDTVALPRKSVAGIVLEFGGPGSHAALLAEALGIPTVAQIPNAVGTIVDDDTVIVDGFGGEVLINPDATTTSRYSSEVEGVWEKNVEAMQSARYPAQTLDGTTISVMANIGSREDVTAAIDNGADGVGLYRMEQFYLARKTPPSAAELLAELQATFDPMKGKPVTVRLLDLGGDKPLPFLKLPPEDNPFLGRRGVRLLLRYPDLLDTQLQARGKLSMQQELRILVPMVTLSQEMAQVRNRLEMAAGDLKLHRPPPLGAMIETPAAALSAREVSLESDFLSIGTNDLTQYTMAAGRENPLVNDYFLEDHPAVLRLVRLTVEEAGGVPVAVCGELARQLNAVPTLLQMGVRSLSVAPPLVPAVKEAIRQVVL